MSLVIPIFIPHQGCPHLCLFCNQKSITGQTDKPIEARTSIQSTIREWLLRSQVQNHVQVAFYGGSFTCLPVERQKFLLEAVAQFIETGQVHSIRLSTRPDCIRPDICAFLKDNGVTTVELGVQSLDDEVLRKSMRGHTAAHCHEAKEHLAQAGLQVGIQLMPGLPGESTRSFFSTVSEAILLNPSLVRLYPALVVAHSGLAEMYEKGEYAPLSLNRAIILCARAKQRFDTAGIPVIRMGLQQSTSLEKTILAGPYHPSFGELVTSYLWFNRVREILVQVPSGRRVEVYISNRDQSAFWGLKKRNQRRLEKLGLLDKLHLVTKNDMERGSLQYVIR